MGLQASLIIGKKILYKYQYHPKMTEAIILDRVEVEDEVTDYSGSFGSIKKPVIVTKYLVQVESGGTILITPDMVKKIID